MCEQKAGILVLKLAVLIRDTVRFKGLMYSSYCQSTVVTECTVCFDYKDVCLPTERIGRSVYSQKNGDHLSISNHTNDPLHGLKDAVGAWGSVVVKVLRYQGSIPGGVTGDFFRGPPDRTMCPEVDSAPESQYYGFLLG